MFSLVNSLELRYILYSSVGTFVFWILKKDKKSDLKIFFILRYFLKKDNILLEMVDVLLASFLCGILTVKILEPTLDKQAIINGMSAVSMINALIKKPAR